MKSIVLLFSLMLVVCLIGAEKKSILYPLTVNDEFPPEYQKAAHAVAIAILKEGLEPREYSAEVQGRENGKILEFVLWHDSALKQRDELRGFCFAGARNGTPVEQAHQVTENARGRLCALCWAGADGRG